MSSVLNFNPGPAVLPKEVLELAAESLVDYRGIGVSVASLSHRSKEIQAILEASNRLIQELYRLPDSFDILWLPGGASAQLNWIPLNFCTPQSTIGFPDTGFWARKASESLRFHCKLQTLGSSSDTGFDRMPSLGIQDGDFDFLYLVSNETIDGVQWNQFPDLGIPLLVDMTSDLFTREFPWERIAVGFASAQKNFGIAGITCVLINRNFLPESAPRDLPPIWNYRTHRDEFSLYHTLPTFPMYVAYLMLDWVAKEGGIGEMSRRARQKAELIYQEIDRNPYLEPLVQKDHRSTVNACFKGKSIEQELKLKSYLTAQGVMGIQGFPTKGGFRASMYNGMPVNDVAILVEYLKKFEE